MDRLLALALLISAAPLLALTGLATVDLLLHLLGSHTAAVLMVSSLVLLRIGLQVAEESRTTPVATTRTAQLSLSLLAVVSLARGFNPVLPGLLPPTWQAPPTLAMALALALTFDIATRTATALAVRGLLPAMRREWLLQQVCREREASTIASIVGHGREDESLLQRARCDLDRALSRIGRRIGPMNPAPSAITTPDQHPAK